MTRIGVLLVLVALIGAPATAAAQTELLINPDLETGDLTGWTVASNPEGGTTVVVAASVAVCAPAAPYDGSYYLSFSLNDGNGAFTAPGDHVQVEQALDVTAFANSIAAGIATVDARGAATSVECLNSPDRVHLEIEFFSGGAGGTSLGTASTQAACSSPPQTDPCRPPDGSGSTPNPSPPPDYLPLDPRESNWVQHLLDDEAVPVGTDTVVFRFVSTLGPSGFSIGTGADGLSLEFTPVELQSFSIE